MRLIFISLSLLVLTSCSGKAHPKMLSFTPASVLIDYSDNDLHEATQMAQQFCGSINKNAQYVNTIEKGIVMTERHAFYNCIADESKKEGAAASPAVNTHAPIINNFK